MPAGGPAAAPPSASGPKLFMLAQAAVVVSVSDDLAAIQRALATQPAAAE